MYVLQMTLGEMDVRLNGQFNHHHHFTTLHRHRLYVDLTLFGLRKWKAINLVFTPAEPVAGYSYAERFDHSVLYVIRYVYCRFWCDVSVLETYLGSSSSYLWSSTGHSLQWVVRSLKDDLGYYVKKEDILSDMKSKGGSKIMDLNKKFTPETWPDHPETATLEAKNKFVGFWIFLGGETILFATLFGRYLALKNKGPSGLEFSTQNFI